MGETRTLVSPARVFARPTADEIWLGPAQQAALSHLSRPAQVRVIAGPSSSGKTTLLHRIGAQLYPNAVVLHCRGPKEDAVSVLAALLLSADLAPWDLSELDQRNLLTVFLQQRQWQKRRVLMLIDDAHTFKAAALEELARLLAVQIDGRPAFELLLAGPPTVATQWQDAREKLGIPEVLVETLGAATLEDLTRYLEWRLARFEMQELVTPGGLETIARLSRGRYAAADVLCQMALLLLRQLGLERVDAQVVGQAVAALAARQDQKLQTDAMPALPEERRQPPPQGYLVVSRRGKVMTRVRLAERTLIGRSEHNDVCVPSPYLSRHHAVIVGTPEGYYLVDLNSVNGVMLNGKRIERTILCDEDVLAMGPFRLKVQIPEWLAQGNPLPEQASLVDTAVMLQPAQDGAAVRRVK